MDGWRKRRPKAKRLPPKVKGQKFQFAAAFVDVVWTPCPAAFPWLLCCIIKFCRYGRRKTSCFPKTLTPSAADKRFNFNEISSTTWEIRNLLYLLEFCFGIYSFIRYWY